MDDLLKNGKFSCRVAFMALMLASAMVSCSDDDDRVYVVRPTDYVSMGMVDEDGCIETDAGNTLIPDASSVKNDLTDGERVFLLCNILGAENRDTYRVRVNKYFQLLTKDIVSASEMTDDDLGEDPINVERSWFGGGYLNLRLGLNYDPSSGVSHSVNLVYDDEKCTADTIRLTLRHNAFSDSDGTAKGYANASFNLQKLLGEGQAKVFVKLKWRWYNPQGVIVEHEDSGYYTASTDDGDAAEDAGDGGVTIK